MLQREIELIMESFSASAEDMNEARRHRDNCGKRFAEAYPLDIGLSTDKPRDAAPDPCRVTDCRHIFDSGRVRNSC